MAIDVAVVAWFVQESVTLSAPPVATRFVGASGAAFGVALTSLDFGPSPFVFEPVSL